MKIANYFNPLKDIYLSGNNPKALFELWKQKMDKVPWLKQLLLNDLINMGVDIDLYSSETVFPFTQTHVKEMKNCVQLLDEILNTLIPRINKILPSEENIEIIYYHGLLSSAGWAYHNKILLGIDKIVELGWDTKERLEDLIIHEYTHIIHAQRRKESIDKDNNYIFRLYIEGVATYNESLFNQAKKHSTWYLIGLENEEELKQEFLKRLESGINLHHFFGDWWSIYNIIEAGYFLGLRWILSIIKNQSIDSIMIMSDIDIKKSIMTYLEAK